MDNIGPNILKCEVRKAIQDMKKGKATGDDEIPVDILKLMGESGIEVLTNLINRIYDSGEWPTDFLEVTMIPLPKKLPLGSVIQLRTDKLADLQVLSENIPEDFLNTKKTSSKKLKTV